MAFASREVDEAGTVPELVVENPLAERVLLYDGEELVGAKQNRILNVSVLVEAKSKLRIPVSCVEQGRWSRVSRHFGSGRTSRTRSCGAARPRRRRRAARARRRPGRGLGRSAREGAEHERRFADGSELGPVSRTTNGTCVPSRTPSRRSRGSAGRSSGSATTLCLDLVSRPDAFVRLWPKLRAGYLLDALERLDGKPTPGRRARGVPRRSHGSHVTRQPSVGLGEDLRLRGDGRDRLGPRGRRRGDPALGVPQRGRRPPRIRPDRAPEPEGVSFGGSPDGGIGLRFSGA